MCKKPLKNAKLANDYMHTHMHTHPTSQPINQLGWTDQLADQNANTEEFYVERMEKTRTNKKSYI